MKRSAEELMWFGEVAWLGSLLALPFFKLNLPGNLWLFPTVVLILLVVMSLVREPLKRYVGYAVIAISIVYLVYALFTIRLWMYLIAGLILLVFFIAAFQWIEGSEWKKNPLAWLILIILTAIIIAVGGAIIGPILVVVAMTMKVRKTNSAKA